MTIQDQRLIKDEVEKAFKSFRGAHSNLHLRSRNKILQIIPTMQNIYYTSAGLTSSDIMDHIHNRKVFFIVVDGRLKETKSTYKHNLALIDNPASFDKETHRCYMAKVKLCYYSPSAFTKENRLAIFYRNLNENKADLLGFVPRHIQNHMQADRILECFNPGCISHYRSFSKNDKTKIRLRVDFPYASSITKRDSLLIEDEAFSSKILNTKISSRNMSLLELD